MNLRSQKRVAAALLKVGENRVWIDPERSEDVEIAISREEIRKLINDKAITKIPEKGVSRIRAKNIHNKKKDGKRRGKGSRKGKKGARTPSKKLWISRVRAQRKKLCSLRDKHVITRSVYRRLYILSKSGSFRSISDLDRYLDTHNLRRQR